MHDPTEHADHARLTIAQFKTELDTLRAELATTRNRAGILGALLGRIVGNNEDPCHPMPEQHPLDNYALAALGAYHDIADLALVLAEWESMSERDRETWRSVADAVLMMAAAEDADDAR